ncbi:MAG: MBL fold metallo-hydrolase, partial [Planctomycetota bacterium]
MKITFYGAARTVTGSQHLIEVNDRRILLDCGLFQGKRKESFELNRRGFCDAKTVDAVILSHAHIDHSGNIPSFVKRGFRGTIFCTAATRDLSAVMLLDSAKIQQRDVEYVNRKREKQKKNLFEPLYTEEDVFQSLRQFIGLPYDRKLEIFPGITLTFIDAGHILGSAITLLDIHENQSGKEIRLVFTGDLGRPGLPIIRDPKTVPEGADILLIESTYGNRIHPPLADLEKELQRIVSQTY